ncbi:uncharacterized protein N7511_002318 [Penicillium nucicola]|uniref:uncharacterized protein n=1 Tax=Penicillium nucicola TaxID=1850975 RepID=UPI0025455742|nr:uncharacterized protein N7511_002318 [Penicillium nucicola]KAJ5770267.1 hypothetical protein N7511_002318 [Penicillium nucicola]
MTQVVKYVLLCLSLFGIWAMWIVPLLCGSLWLLIYESQRKEFVGANYSGISLLDKALSPFLLAYTLTSDTGVAVENLHMAGFLGSMAGIWMMSAIENNRTKSRDEVAKGQTTSTEQRQP